MSKEYIPYHVPFPTHHLGLEFVKEVLLSGKTAGNQIHSEACKKILPPNFHGEQKFLTTSCTSALEFSALLASVEPGDHVILPSYTFPSTANAFLLRGATLSFVDSMPNSPNMDLDAVEELISSKTKVLCVMHYAGISLDWEKIKALKATYNLTIIEDAAQCIDAYYVNNDIDYPLGSLGDFGAISFHETKNISCGEGGLLLVNNQEYIEKAEMMYEKGTNRASFLRKESEFYEWKSIGSSYTLSEINAAILHGQLLQKSEINKMRQAIWNSYNLAFENISVPYVPSYAKHNAHIFYLQLASNSESVEFIEYMQKKRIQTLRHYRPLHSSSFFNDKHDGRILKNAQHFSDTLVRLPIHQEVNVNRVIETALDFFN